jgi:hypothetical protein
MGCLRDRRNIWRQTLTPCSDAINGTYIDKKCPFTGDVSIRGRILTGVVHSTKMTNTIIIRREYLHLWVLLRLPLR